MFLINLVKKLNKNKLPYALVGGHAVAFHGAVRGTMDVDLVLKWSLKTLEDTETLLKYPDYQYLQKMYFILKRNISKTAI